MLPYFVCSLIIATKFRAKDVVLRLVEFLAPSRPVVVYSQHKEVESLRLENTVQRQSIVELEGDLDSQQPEKERIILNSPS